jgi:hypothetical protein
MRRFSILLAVLSLAVGYDLKAQSSQSNNKIEIEIDPVAYVLKGYSFHLIYTHRHLRYDVGIFGLEQPKSLRTVKNYKAVSNGAGFKINYQFKPLNSFYTGIDVGIGKTKLTSNITGDSDTNNDINIGIHGGYKVFLFSKTHNFLNGIYITPWAGVSYNYFYTIVKFVDYKENPVGYFATLHVGYRF